MRHAKGVIALAFHPAGHTLVSAGHDGRLKFWDLPSRSMIDALVAPGPYSGMKRGGATGLSDAQIAALSALGAVR
jgi:WD40 repeat protein